MERFIDIDGKNYRLVANGLTPRKYRELFGKEVFLGMQKAIGADSTILDSEVFENLAFCMAVQGGSMPEKTIDEWLEKLDNPMAVIEVASDIMEMWMAETKTTSVGKKE